MTISELLNQLTRVFFVLLAAITLIEYLRYRDRVRRDVALVFLCLIAGILVQVGMSIFGIENAWLPRLGSMIVLAQPYLLLRIVRYFRPVRPLMRWTALLGMVLSWIMLLLVIDQESIPAGVTLVIVVYFIVIDGYAIYSFIQGAFSSTGVVRKRLQFAAIGSSMLVLALLVVGIRTILPNMAAFTIPVTQIFAVLSAIAYYLSFAPPRWLRQGWQLAELRDYLQQVQSLAGKSRIEVLRRLCDTVSRAMGTEQVGVLLADSKGETLAIEEACSSPALLNLPSGGVALRSWMQRAPEIVVRKPKPDDDDARFIADLDVEVMLVIPIVTQDSSFGVVVVCLEYGSLFVDDDLRLLSVIVQQTAVMLENEAVLSTLRQQTAALEQQVGERTRALARSNQELQQFAYVASHDLKEPLRTISSYLELIEQRYADRLDEDGREFIDFAVDGASRMRSLIDDLLVYSRVETRTHDFVVLDSQAVLDNACKLLEMSIAESGAVIHSDSLPKVRADEGLLGQLFQNLISNAIKYNDGQPEINISARRDGRFWEFAVRDNGIGIDEKQLDRIFVIFQRLHTQTEYSGTGIGLAICRKTVELHGGRIWAESEPGQGSTFYFTLPA